jgi:hypothetical protein
VCHGSPVWAARPEVSAARSPGWPDPGDVGLPERDEASRTTSATSTASRVPILGVFAAQLQEAPPFLRGFSEERSLHRYAPGKWSAREVLSHVNDAERLFAFRALWFARGFDSPLPSFDQDTSAVAAKPDAVAWERHVEEFEAIRRGTLALFGNLPEEAWSRRGIASDNPFSVRALAYITAGHLAHHLAVLRERYAESR